MCRIMKTDVPIANGIQDFAMEMTESIRIVYFSC